MELSHSTQYISMFEYIVQFMLNFFKENNRHSSNNIIFILQSKIAPNAKMLPILFRGLHNEETDR